jgi:hypothetical protein
MAGYGARYGLPNISTAQPLIGQQFSSATLATTRTCCRQRLDWARPTDPLCQEGRMADQESAESIDDKWAKAEKAVRDELDEVEVAALMTVDEIKDTVHDAIDKVKGAGHHGEGHGDQDGHGSQEDEA